ncbi:CLUMA_CG007258, isoform A [Clunio marinus]|uniref:CLUMA_CG007258, isoform A n=1 Tax=Clunio marinus TaxID=568069 RepID=A0A1J1I1U8_9DIPT|nr:CLUMA_CG007258, isoform A [Clunio marinus]
MKSEFSHLWSVKRLPKTASATIIYQDVLASRKLLAISVHEIINKVFPKHGTSNDLFYSINDFIIKDFIEELFAIHPRLIFRHGNFTFLPKDLTRCVVLVIKSFNEFLEFYSSIPSTSIKSNGFYLIVFVNGRIKEIGEIFKILWKIDFFNVNVMFADKDELIKVETFIPFTEGNCNNTTPKLINEFVNGTFNQGIDEFFPKKFKDLKGCFLRFTLPNDSEPFIIPKVFINGTYNTFEGSEMMLGKVLAEALNFQINITYAGFFGYVLDNGTAVGPLKELLEGRADITVGAWWLKLNRIKVLDMTSSHMSETLIIIIPPGQQLTPFEKLIFPFTLPSWILIIVSYFCGFMVVILAKFRNKSVRNFIVGSNIKNPVLNFYAACLGVSNHVLPKRNFARFYLMMFMISSLIIRTLYEASFFLLIHSNKHHKEMQSIDELIAEDYHFYMRTGTFDFAKTMKKLEGRSSISEYEHEEESIKRIREDPNFKGVFIHSQIEVLYKYKKRPSEAQPTFCKELFLSNLPTVAYTRKNFFLIDSLNEKIELLGAAGIIYYWNRETKKNPMENAEVNVALNIYHFLGCFQLLLFGFLLSFLTFLKEKFTNRCK